MILLIVFVGKHFHLYPDCTRPISLRVLIWDPESSGYTVHMAIAFNGDAYTPLRSVFL